jgi:acetoin utilization deacetylase AcuC-like enzyme
MFAFSQISASDLHRGYTDGGFYQFNQGLSGDIVLTFYNEQHAQHSGRFEIYRGEMLPCFEKPERADFVLAELQRRNLGKILAPQGVSLVSLERIHSLRYLDFLRHAWSDWIALDPANVNKDAFPAVWPIRGLRHDIEPTNFCAKLGLYSMDCGSPLTAGTWIAAKAGADCAVNAAHALRLGERGTFALTRPPGHHAGADFYGGYCFLNNAALAAQHLLDDGARRVAILDVDYHHGNGTQSIFYERNDVLFVSIHGDPRTEFPFYLGHADETGAGAGLGYNLNLPLPSGASNGTWFAALETACIRIASNKPDALVISLGVDTFAGDPISGFSLQSADYLRLGERIALLDLPTVFVFEGGYAVNEIGVNVVNVLEGFETC